MDLPELLNRIDADKKQIVEFKGLDMRETISDGEMRDMKNLTSDYYPSLRPRAGRGVLDVHFYGADGTTEVYPSNVIVHKGNVAALSDTDFWYGYTTVNGVNTARRIPEMNALIATITGFDANSATIVSLNERIYIFPYMIYFNANSLTVTDLNVCGKIGLSFDSSADTTDTGNTLSWTYDSAGLKDSSVLTLFCLTEEQAKTNVRTLTDYIGATLKIRFTWGGAEYINMGALEKVSYIGVSGSSFAFTITFPSSTFANMPTNGANPLLNSTLWKIGTTGVTPNLDYVVERDNRLWGCCNEDNTIYASKLGSGMTWDDYSGLTTDSYAVQLTSDGKFTGICKFSTHIIFFKEDKLHKIYGSIPANYTLQTTEAYGVEAGSSKSVASLNGIAYYKSPIGIMAYDGNYPTPISGVFGDNSYTDAVSGICGYKYYVSLKDAGAGDDSTNYHLFCYDTMNHIWMHEDCSKVLNFFRIAGNTYMIREYKEDSIDEIRLVRIDSPDPVVFTDSDETRVEWRALLGPFDERIEDKKVYSTMQMRLKLSLGSTVEVRMRTDGGDWQKVKTISGDSERSQILPIIPRRCSNFEILLQGRGLASIQSLLRRYREGSMY